MVAQMPEQRAQCDVRHADEDGGDVFLLHGFDDFRDIGAGLFFGNFAQKVVAAYADNHKLGFACQQRRQARQGLRGRIARYAAVDNIPTRQFLQLRGVGFARVCAVAEGERIAQGKYGASFGNFGVGSGGFSAAGGKKQRACAEEEGSSVHWFFRRHRAISGGISGFYGKPDSFRRARL